MAKATLICNSIPWQIELGFGTVVRGSSPWSSSTSAVDAGFEPILNSYFCRRIRIVELGWEEGHPSKVLGITKAAGKPVRITDRSLAGDYGHYLRVLVDLSFSLPILEQVMIERKEPCTLSSLWVGHIGIRIAVLFPFSRMG